MVVTQCTNPQHRRGPWGGSAQRAARKPANFPVITLKTTEGATSTEKQQIQTQNRQHSGLLSVKHSAFWLVFWGSGLSKNLSSPVSGNTPQSPWPSGGLGPKYPTFRSGRAQRGQRACAARGAPPVPKTAAEDTEQWGAVTAALVVHGGRWCTGGGPSLGTWAARLLRQCEGGTPLQLRLGKGRGALLGKEGPWASTAAPSLGPPAQVPPPSELQVHRGTPP